MFKYFVSFLCFIFILISCAQSDFQKAVNYQNDREYDKAITFYNLAIDKNENVALAQKNKGDIYLIKKDIEHAYSCYCRSLELDPNLPMDYLLKLLSDRDKTVRKYTIGLLAIIKNPETKKKIFENISKVLKSEKPFEKLDALEVVSYFGNKIEPIIGDVVELVNDNNITIQQKVFEILPKISDIAVKAGAIEKLLYVSENSNDMISASAIECVGKLGNFSYYLPRLIELIKSKPALKNSVFDTVNKVNRPSQQEAKELLKYLEPTEDIQIRLLVLSIFKKMGNEANIFVPKLIILSVDKDESISKAANEIISNISVGASSAVDELIGLLDSDNKTVKIKAIRELANIGQNALSAIEPLQKLTKNSDKEIKSSAQIAIKQIQK